MICATAIRADSPRLRTARMSKPAGPLIRRGAAMFESFAGMAAFHSSSPTSGTKGGNTSGIGAGGVRVAHPATPVARSAPSARASRTHGPGLDRLRLDHLLPAIFIPELEKAGRILRLQDDVGVAGPRRTGQADPGGLFGRAELHRWTPPLGDEAQEHRLRIPVALGRRPGGQYGDAGAHAALVVHDLQAAPAQDG